MARPSLRLAFLHLVIPPLAFCAAAAAQDITSIWSGGTGVWSNGAKWSTHPRFPSDTQTQAYAAIINNGNVTLDRDLAVDRLALGQSGQPLLQGNRTLAVRSAFHLNNTAITGNGTLNALGDANITGANSILGWYVTLSGHTVWSGQVALADDAVIDNLSGATLDFEGGAAVTLFSDQNALPASSRRTLYNEGTINLNGPGYVLLNLPLNNAGAINLNSGTLNLGSGSVSSGTITLAANTLLTVTGTAYYAPFVFTPTSSISGAGGISFGGNTPLVVRGKYDVTGPVTINTSVVFGSPITHLAGDLFLNAEYGVFDIGSSSAAVTSLHLQVGTLTGSGTLTVTGPMEWNEGSLLGGGTVNANSGIFFNGITGTGGFNKLQKTLNCGGNSTVQTTNAYYGNLNFLLNAALNILPGATFNGSRLGIQGSSVTGHNNGTITNSGTLVVDNPELNHGMFVSGTGFVNNGAIQVTNSALNVQSQTATPAIVQNGGSITLSNGTLGSSCLINAGSLTGFGQVVNLTTYGLTAPSGGNLDFQNTRLTLKPKSVLSFILNGAQPGVGYDQLVNIGTGTLGGTLRVSLGEGTSLQQSDTFTIISGQTLTGQFANVTNGARLATTDGRGSFLVTYKGTSVVLSDFH